jgi:hypothetical protein
MRGPVPPHEVPCRLCGAPVACRCLGADHRRRCDACDPFASRRGPDVLKLVPLTSDIAHLERMWTFDERTSPLEMLEAWQPTDEADEAIRSYLIAFGRSVLAAAGVKLRVNLQQAPSGRERTSR